MDVLELKKLKNKKVLRLSVKRMRIFCDFEYMFNKYMIRKQKRGCRLIPMPLFYLQSLYPIAYRKPVMLSDLALNILGIEIRQIKVVYCNIFSL